MEGGKGSPGKAEGSARRIRCRKIRTWTIRSGAVAGVAEGAYIFAVPGSTAAYEDAKFPFTCRAPATSPQLLAGMPRLKGYPK